MDRWLKETCFALQRNLLESDPPPLKSNLGTYNLPRRDITSFAQAYGSWSLSHHLQFCTEPSRRALSSPSIRKIASSMSASSTCRALESLRVLTSVSSLGIVKPQLSSGSRYKYVLSCQGLSWVVCTLESAPERVAAKADCPE